MQPQRPIGSSYAGRESTFSSPPLRPVSRPVRAGSDIRIPAQRTRVNAGPTLPRPTITSQPMATQPVPSTIPPAQPVNSGIVRPNAASPVYPASQIQQIAQPQSIQPPNQSTLPAPSPQLPPLEPPVAVSEFEKTPWWRSIADTMKAGGAVAFFIGTILGGAMLLNAFVFQSYYVDGLSMQPTLQDNDRLIVSKVERTSAQGAGEAYIPRRGQIVVIDTTASHFSQLHNEQIIKRIIGLPGETVVINDGKVTVINDENPGGFDVDHLLGLSLDPTFSQEPIRIKIPEDSVYVLGDNRAEGGSYDSRMAGPIDSDLIVGRLFVRVLPINEVRVF